MKKRERRTDARFDEREIAPGVVIKIPELQRALRRGLNIRLGSDDTIERAAVELTRSAREWIELEGDDDE
jgi:hypothetical protein